MNLLEIGGLIRQRRAVLGITQQHLAAVSEVALVTIKLLELGKGNPSFGTLEKLTGVLGLEILVGVKTMQR
ncbi:MAG: helix-turn-helix domain-containing protein [Cytophagales bacterium]|nr:helix-turn-helix domain-containing protein [Cytophagales bacterium]